MERLGMRGQLIAHWQQDTVPASPTEATVVEQEGGADFWSGLEARIWNCPPDEVMALEREMATLARTHRFELLKAFSEWSDETLALAVQRSLCPELAFEELFV